MYYLCHFLWRVINYLYFFYWINCCIIITCSDHIIADPTLLEEGVAEAFLSIGLNAYKELCGLHLGGKAQLSTSVILETTNKAARRACQVIEMIKTQVEQDTANKYKIASDLLKCQATRELFVDWKWKTLVSIRCTLRRMICLNLGSWVFVWTIGKVQKLRKRKRKLLKPPRMMNMKVNDLCLLH